MSERDLIAAARGAATELGVTDGTAEELAVRLGAGRRRLSWLLDLLAADGWLARNGDRYRVLGAPAAAPGAKLLTVAVRRDAPLRLDEVAGNLDAARLTCHDGITRVPSALVAAIASRLGDGELLDLGCGDGALAAAVLAVAPRARARLVDRDARHAAHLRGPRCAVIAADLATLVAPPARVVLLSNVLHMADVPELLVQRAAALVEPGGALVIREIALAADRSGPRFGIAFGLSLLIFGDTQLPVEASLAEWARPCELERTDESIILVAPR